MIAPATPPPAFQLGQLVRHRRYGYRGVIVEYDLLCTAPDNWYYSNRTQPDRNQPWYHVLVHQSDGAMTYAAQTSLEADLSNQPIDHPLIDLFFEKFADGGYLRNDRAFSGE